MSKISRKKLFILGTLCSLIMCISGIYAFTNTTILKLKNEVNTGAINIELNEYSVNNGKETLYTEEEKVVLPGEIVSLIPRISNLGDSSYVRAKLSYTGEGNNIVPISDANLQGLNENWEKKGEYWYYKKEVKPGEKIDVFNGLQIPNDLSNDYQGKIMQLNIIAEAVQSANFNPDFNSTSPWNSIKAEGSNTTYQGDKVQMTSNAKIEYENSANLYMDISEDFFTELAHVLPGDTLSEQININNKNNSSLEYVISTQKPEGISGKASELLDKLQLKIISDKGVIYEGNACGLNKFSLGEYDGNTMSKLTFIISVPEELGNEYANLNSAISWTFDVIGEDIPKVESPQTGDVKVKIAIGIFVVATIGLIAVVYLNRKNKK